MTLKQIKIALEKHKDSLAKERDKIRDLLDEVELHHKIAKDAVESLIYAIDRLSEQV